VLVEKIDRRIMSGSTKLNQYKNANPVRKISANGARGILVFICRQNPTAHEPLTSHRDVLASTSNTTGSKMERPMSKRKAANPNI